MLLAAIPIRTVSRRPGIRYSNADMNDSPATRNVKLVVAYNGAAYHGWQRQAAGIDTVQFRLEQAAGQVLGHPVTVHGAGRTDAGVHAEGQVANLHTTNLAVPLAGMRRAVNSRLPDDIAVRSAVQVDDGFHASRSAVGKTYRYRIHVSPQRAVMRHRQVYHYWRTLDVEAMRSAAQRLIGTHDFAGFATSADDRDNTVRTIFRCEVAEAGPEVHVTVQGNAFLYNMVRIIVGTLIEVGRGRWAPGCIDRALSSGNRAEAGPTAPPDGLTMVCVHYDRGEIAPRG